MRFVRPFDHSPRRGTVLPMLGVCLIGLFAFTALAIDLGDTRRVPDGLPERGRHRRADRHAER